MNIINVAPPSGNAITDTQNIQAAIDQWYSSNQQTTIQLQPGKYVVSYLCQLDDGVCIEGSQLESAQVDPDTLPSNYKWKGVSIPAISSDVPNDPANYDSNFPFLTFKGSETAPTVIFQAVIYNEPALNEDIRNYLNTHFLGLSKIKLAKVEETITTDLVEFETLVSNANEAIGAELAVLRRILYHLQFLDPDSVPENAEFQALVLNHYDAIVRWWLLRGGYNYHRCFTFPYEHIEDSKDMYFTNLTFDGNWPQIEKKGWEFNNTQFEQSAILFIDPSKKLPGKIVIDFDSVNFNYSVGNGIHITQNVKSTFSNIETRYCKRGGIVVTGTNFDINITNYKSYTGDGFNDGFNMEIDHVNFTAYFNLQLRNIEVNQLKLTTGPGAGDIQGYKIFVKDSFAQRGYKCRTTIVSSRFYINPNFGRGVDILSPGETKFINCRFAVNPAYNRSYNGPELEGLVQVRMYYNALDSINQTLTFQSCSFLNVSNQFVGYGINIVREEQNGNVVYVDNCSFVGRIRNAISHQGCHLLINKSLYKLYYASQIDNKEGAFVRSFDYSVNEPDLAIRLTLIGKATLVNVPFHIILAKVSKFTVIEFIEVHLPQSDNNLLLDAVNLDVLSRLLTIGNRIIENDTGIVDPNISKVDGIKGDLFVSDSSGNNDLASVTWKCTQTGDHGLNKTAIWVEQ